MSDKHKRPKPGSSSSGSRGGSSSSFQLYRLRFRLEQFMEKNPAELIISVLALLLAVIHLFWPGVRIDGTALVLIIIAIIPWLPQFMKRIELPGGIKVEFRDVTSASEKIIGLAGMKEEPLPAANADFNLPSETDPNIALVSLRIEIEKRIKTLAKIHSVSPGERASLGKLLYMLEQKEVISSSFQSGVYELVFFGNQAAHGAFVSEEAAAVVLQKGPRILGAIDGMIEGGEGKRSVTETVEQDVKTTPVSPPFSRKYAEETNRLQNEERDN